MARPYSVTPIIRPGHRAYSATFQRIDGRRVTRGLRTADLATARIICDGLVACKLQAVGPAGPASESIPEISLQLWRGVDAVAALPRVVTPPTVPPARFTAAELADLPESMRERVGATIDQAQLAASEVERLTRENQALQAEVAALRSDLVTRAGGAGRNSPPIATALQAFEEHMRATACKAHADHLVSVARRFAATLPAAARTPAQITVDHIQGYLDPKRGIDRWIRARRELGRFVNWAAERWEYRSQMQSVRRPRAAVTAGAREEIEWYELREVEVAIAALPDVHWRALVGVMVYAGLRLSEAVWLRPQDYSVDRRGRAQLWIDTVDHGDGIRHVIKSANSRGAVNVNSHLRPLLERHLDAGGPGRFCLFPVPISMRRRGGKGGAAAELWPTKALGHYLMGDPGSKDPGAKKKKKPRPGLLPAGWSTRNLRHTCGSLMLRAGHTLAEVAAALRNTEEVVRQHYARLMGSEVRIDLTSRMQTEPL